MFPNPKAEMSADVWSLPYTQPHLLVGVASTETPRCDASRVAHIFIDQFYYLAEMSDALLDLEEA